MRGPLTGGGPAPGTLVGRRGRSRPAFAPGFTMRDAKGETVVRLVRRDGLPRGGDRRDSRRQQDLLDARLLAGREPPRPRAARSARHRRRRRRSRRRPASARPMQSSDLEDGAAAGASQRRRLYRAVAARAVPGTPARRLPLLRHASRRSQRRRPARAPARAARAEGVRRVDEPRRHEGGQHARHADHRERRERRAPLPAGRRLDVRHRRQRAARVRRRVGVPLRRRPRAGSGSSPSASTCSRGRPCEYVENAGDRPVRGRRSSIRPSWKPRVPTAAFRRARGRRHVLGGAARDGVLRRDDPRHRGDRPLQRRVRGAAARRRADPAARQDRPRLPDRHQSRREHRARRQTAR